MGKTHSRPFGQSAAARTRPGRTVRVARRGRDSDGFIHVDPGAFVVVRWGLESKIHNGGGRGASDPNFSIAFARFAAEVFLKSHYQQRK